MLVEPRLGAPADGSRGVWVGGVEELHAGLEAGGVKGVDGEGTVAALGASGTAGEPWAGTCGCIGKGFVHCL